MSPRLEDRKFPRCPVRYVKFTVTLEVPTLLDTPLVPDDISPMGFKITIPKKPEENDEFGCTIEFRDVRYENCLVRVVWTRPVPARPGVWETGLLIDMHEDHRTDYHQNMLEALRSAGLVP